jgi:hypothetical protein
VADKLCRRCGALNVAQANLCALCGVQELTEVPAELMQGLLLLSMRRVVLLSVVSSGLYFFYWLYLTWKHLESETGEIHYPVWHTLTLFVPIYGLFRLHRHVSVIQGLALGAGVETSLSPGLAVVLVALNWTLGLGAERVDSLAVLVLINAIGLALTTTVVAWSQDSLNKYWGRAEKASLQDAPAGRGEVAIVLLGILAWINASLTFL